MNSWQKNNHDKKKPDVRTAKWNYEIINVAYLYCIYIYEHDIYDVRLYLCEKASSMITRYIEWSRWV